MKKAAILGTLFFLASGGVVTAATLKETKTICAPGSVTRTSDAFANTAAGGSGALKNFIGSTNFCTDDKLSIDVGLLSSSFTDVSTCICPTQDQFTKIGCDAGQRQPKVTVSVPSIASSYFNNQKTITISKCAPDFGGAFQAAMSGQDMSYVQPGSQAAGTAVSANAMSPQAIAAAQNALQSGNLEQGLSAIGANPDQIKSIVSGDPQNAQKLLQDIASGNAQAAKQDAAALNLNPSLSGDVLTLNAAPSVGDATGKVIGTPESSVQSSGSTFVQSGTVVQAQPQCGVDGIAGSIMAAESSCGKINYNPLSTVQGPYHYLCGTWQSDTAAVGMSQYSDCSYRNDAGIATQVVNARYGLYQQQYGSQCADAGQTWTSCAYAIHVFGEGGFRRILSAAQSNPDASAYSVCGSVITQQACGNNNSIFRNGGTVAGIFSELDRRLSVSGAGMSVPLAGTSPFSGLFQTSGQGFSAAYNSGVSFASPFSFLSPLNSLASVWNAGSASYVPSGIPAIQATNQQTAPVQISIPASSSIAVRPARVAVGTPVVVSWSSLGMRTCVVIKGTMQVALGSNGMTPVALTEAGTSTFALVCTSIGGSISERSASAVAY